MNKIILFLVLLFGFFTPSPSYANTGELQNFEELREKVLYISDEILLDDISRNYHFKQIENLKIKNDIQDSYKTIQDIEIQIIQLLIIVIFFWLFLITFPKEVIYFMNIISYIIGSIISIIFGFIGKNTKWIKKFHISEGWKIAIFVVIIGPIWIKFFEYIIDIIKNNP